MGGEDPAIEGQRRLVGSHRVVLPSRLGRLVADLGLEEAQHQAVVRLAQARHPGRELVGAPPLALLLAELLEADQGVDVLGVDVEDLFERPCGAIDEAGLAKVHAEAHQGVGPFAAAQVRAVQKALVDADRALHLTRLPQQVAQDQLDLDGVRFAPRRLRQLGGREVCLPRGQVVKPLGVVRRGAEPAASREPRDPEGAGAGAAGEEPRYGGQDHRQEGGVGHAARRLTAWPRPWRRGPAPSLPARGGWTPRTPAGSPSRRGPPSP